MPRPEKVQAVADIKERLEDSAGVFLAEYAGLSVAEQQELRRSLRAAGGEFKVLKMTLARIAAQELGYDMLLEELSGPTGLAFTSGDAAAAAKVLRDFAKEHQQLVLKAGLLDGEPLTRQRVEQLADLDSRAVLLAKIAGAFQAPTANMAGLMAALPRNLASMMLQLMERLPAAEAPASRPEAVTEPEAPAEEAAAKAAEEPVAETEESSGDDAAGASAEGTEATTEDDTAESAEEE